MDTETQPSLPRQVKVLCNITWFHAHRFSTTELFTSILCWKGGMSQHVEKKQCSRGADICWLMSEEVKTKQLNFRANITSLQVIFVCKLYLFKLGNENIELRKTEKFWTLCDLLWFSPTWTKRKLIDFAIKHFSEIHDISFCHQHTGSISKTIPTKSATPNFFYYYNSAFYKMINFDEFWLLSFLNISLLNIITIGYMSQRHQEGTSINHFFENYHNSYLHHNC